MVALFSAMDYGVLKRDISIRMLFPSGAMMEARVRKKF
jgi:hypothetical protein